MTICPQNWCDTQQRRHIFFSFLKRIEAQKSEWSPSQAGSGCSLSKHTLYLHTELPLTGALGYYREDKDKDKAS